MEIEKDLLNIMTSSGIGEGEPDLGMKLAESFFSVLAQADSAPAAGCGSVSGLDVNPLSSGNGKRIPLAMGGG